MSFGRVCQIWRTAGKHPRTFAVPSLYSRHSFDCFQLWPQCTLLRRWRSNLHLVKGWCSGILSPSCISQLDWWMSSNCPSSTRTRLSSCGCAAVNSFSRSIWIRSCWLHRQFNFKAGSYLSMKDHVSRMCRTSYYQLWQLRVIRQSLTTGACTQLVHALINSRLDYCNSLLSGVTNQLLSQLQSEPPCGRYFNGESLILVPATSGRSFAGYSSDRDETNSVSLSSQRGPCTPLRDDDAIVGHPASSPAPFGRAWKSPHPPNSNKDLRSSLLLGLWAFFMEFTPGWLEKHWTNIKSLKIPFEDTSLSPSLWTITLSETRISTLAMDIIHGVIGVLYKLSFELNWMWLIWTRTSMTIWQLK